MGVWGTIAYQIVETISTSKDKISGEVKRDQNGGREPESFIYASDVRDPFRYVPPARRDTTHHQAVPKKIVLWTPPPLKLTGILLADKKKTALMEGAGGSMFFLHEGDTLMGVKIIRIKDQVVTYSYTKKKAEWTMVQP